MTDLCPTQVTLGRNLGTGMNATNLLHPPTFVKASHLFNKQLPRHWFLYSVLHSLREPAAVARLCSESCDGKYIGQIAHAFRYYYFFRFYEDLPSPGSSIYGPAIFVRDTYGLNTSLVL